MRSMSTWARWGLGLGVPVALILLILGADAAEGPKTAYVGVLAVVPMLSAVFASPRITLAVAVVTWLAAFAFGHFASDGNVAAQQVRLVIIALAGAAAVGAAYLRRRRDRVLVNALREAAAADTLREQAETDQLTGLSNRHGLINRIATDTDTDDSLARTVAVIDCDGLKTVNDSLGHLAGDTYLQAIAGRLHGSLAKSDLIARWGGDEFLVVQRLDLSRAMAALTRMHRTIDASPISIDGTMVDASVSVGVAEWPTGMTFDEAIAAADQALYAAKSKGRNQIVTSA
jgi:diguanylate cyclase (GGDEF)-like protein